MSDATTPRSGVPDLTHPPAIYLDQVWPWALFGAALLMLIYFVAFDQGAAALVPGETVHEWVHDGRHLLGFPCH